MTITYSESNPEVRNCVPWNFGVKIGPKRTFNQKQVLAIPFLFDHEARIRAIQILLRRPKIKNTVRYLGVDIEVALKLAEKTES